MLSVFRKNYILRCLMRCILRNRDFYAKAKILLNMYDKINDITPIFPKGTGRAHETLYLTFEAILRFFCIFYVKKRGILRSTWLVTCRLQYTITHVLGRLQHPRRKPRRVIMNPTQSGPLKISFQALQNEN